MHYISTSTFDNDVSVFTYQSNPNEPDYFCTSEFTFTKSGDEYNFSSRLQKSIGNNKVSLSSNPQSAVNIDQVINCNVTMGNNYCKVIMQKLVLPSKLWLTVNSYSHFEKKMFLVSD